MLLKPQGILSSQKFYSEKRITPSPPTPMETTMSIQKLIRETKYEELKFVFLENKNIDSKIAEDSLISLFKNKEKIPKELIELILRFDPDLNRSDNDGKNALIYAAERGDLDLVKIMVNHKANTEFINKENKNALFYAIDNKENKESLEIIKILAPLSNVDVISKEGDTPLTKAVERQLIQIVEVLLENNANPNIKNLKNNDTPLHLCLKNRNQKIFMLLIEKKSDVKLQNKKNISALDLIENDKEFKTLYESWLNLQPKTETLIKNELENLDDTNEKKKKKKTTKSINKNIINVQDTKISSEIFSEKKGINNILEQISMKTEKSTTSRQSFNSKSEENPGENENKKNNSKDQSIDSKRSENIDSQLRMQNYITEIEKNKLEIKALKNTIKSNFDKIKDLESKMEALNKENHELKKTNEDLRMQGTAIKKICTSDIQKLLVEKTLKPEQKITLMHGEALNLNFEKEIVEFYDTVIGINNSNKPLFEKLIDNFKNLISEVFPEAKIHLFGSYATDLCLPYSDIDLVIELPNASAETRPTRADIEKNLQKLEEILKKETFIQETKTVFTASIPLIKIMCKEEFLNKKVDITIQDQNHNGIKCVALIKDYIKDFPLLKYLVLVLKHLLHNCDLSDSYLGGLSSYALILMVGSFLQMKKYKNLNSEENPGLIGQTLLEFLYFFGKKFNYFNSVINPALNTVFPYVFSNCVWNQSPEGFYFPLEKLRIIDPITEKNDVGRCTFHISSIKSIFYNAYLSLKLNYCLENGFDNDPENKLTTGHETKHCSCNLKKMFYLPKIFGI